MRLLPFVAALAALALAGCKATGARTTGSALLTDETKASMRTVCRDVYANHDAKERVDSLCSCLGGKRSTPGFEPLVRRFCDEGAGLAFYRRFEQLLLREGDFVIRDDAGTTPTARDNECVRELAADRVESSIDLIERTCKENDIDALRSLIMLPEPAPAGECKRLRRMNDRQCFVQAPCDDFSGAGDVAYCNPKVQTMHRLKDPTGATLDYNYPFASLLAGNRSTANITYGAANCHGTAQALSGDFLSELPVTGLSFHGDHIKGQCETKAQAAYDAAREKKGKHLPIERGGYVVNMNHDASCSASSCGDITFHTFSCENDRLESHVFLLDMCINCWDGLLRKAGYDPLPKTATWKDLKPGCVMTAVDHTVTSVYSNDGLCYYYESLSPYAAPQINVQTCPMLFDRFPRRWCPRGDVDMLGTRS